MLAISISYRDITRMAIFAFLCLIIPRALHAQITVTQSQYSSIFTAGQVHYFYNADTTLTTVNVGKKGGANTYDFSGLPNFSMNVSHNYLISDIPTLAARFPGNGITFGTSPDSVERNPVFLFGTDTMYVLGEASLVPQLQFKHYNPPQRVGIFPLVYGGTNNYSYQLTDTTYNSTGGVASVNQANGVDSMKFDGYGTLKIPGYTLQCLRALLRHTSFGDKEFMYFTREGVYVDVMVSATEPDTGTVNIMHFMVLRAQAVTGVEETREVPLDFSLAQNYPNPFNPITVITYRLPESGRVALKVYDIRGRKVRTLVDETQVGGIHSAIFDGSECASGVYLYRITFTSDRGGIVQSTRKLVMIK